MADIPRVNPADMARLITENLANPGSIPGGESSPLPFDPAPDEQPATATESPEVVQGSGAGEGAVGVAPQEPPPPQSPFDPALSQPGVRVDPSTSRPFFEQPDPTPTPPEPQPTTAIAPTEPPALPDPATDGATNTDTGHADIGLIYQLALGHDPTPDEVVQTISLASRVASLDEQRQQWVNAIMTGQIDPAQIEAQLTRANTPAPVPATPADPYADPYDTPVSDPALEAERAALAAEREQLRAQAAEYQRQQLAQIRTQAEAAWQEFASQHSDWAPEELTALRVRVDASNVFGAELQSGKDPRSAFLNTINYEALTHDHFRSKMLAAAALDPNQTAAEASRTNAAAALAGNGQGSGGAGGARGAVGATPPPRPEPGATLPPPNPALTTTLVPAGYSGAAYDPTTQQPVLPAASPLTAPRDDAAPDLTNRNTQALLMAQEIARLTGGG